MTDQASPARPGTALWIIGVVALLWNLIGLYIFYTSMMAVPEQLAQQFNAEQVAQIQATPAWVDLVMGIATIAGVIGSILLLMRNRLAVPLFIVSLVALIFQDIYLFGMSDSLALFGTSPLIVQGIVLLVAIFLTWYSRQKRAQGVLT